MSKIVRIRTEIFTQIQHETLLHADMESCGLLAGSDEIITRAFPATNSLASATAYEVAPVELFRLMKQIRAAGLQMMGIYHSHPKGDNSPSSSDIARAHYPDAAYFIISPLPSAAHAVRAFSIRNGEVTELKIEIAP